MKLRAPPVTAEGVGCVVLVQANLLGAALSELGKRGASEPTGFLCFNFLS